MGKGIHCDQFQVDVVYQLFEQGIYEGFDAKGETQGIELHFMITAVHGWNIHGKVPLAVDVLPDLKGF